MRDFDLETEIRFAARKSKPPIKTPIYQISFNRIFPLSPCRMERRLYCAKSFLVVWRIFNTFSRKYDVRPWYIFHAWK